MSKDKYTSMFSRKIEAVVLIILQIFCNAHETVFTNSSLFAAKYIPLRRYNPQNVLSSSIKFLMKTYRSGC